MTETRKLRVFLCHASQDKPTIREFYQRLSATPQGNPCLDEEKILSSQDWDTTNQKVILWNSLV